jgi:uncharacterized membrane protein
MADYPVRPAAADDIMKKIMRGALIVQLLGATWLILLPVWTLIRSNRRRRKEKEREEKEREVKEREEKERSHARDWSINKESY